MIASITGILKQKTPHSIIVDVHGVGYEAVVPLTTFYLLPSQNETVHLWTYTHVREDALQLFGFSTVEEKNVFLLLLGISGIGPKLAINILSGLPLAELVAAVKQGDIAKLSSIPGIGRKTAARLALELKEKILAVTVDSSAAPVEEKDARRIEDAVSALVNLGYKSPLAKDAVKKVLNARNGEDGREGFPIEELIKESLKVLSKT